LGQEAELIVSEPGYGDDDEGEVQAEESKAQ